jgi:hypothetical protein
MDIALDVSPLDVQHVQSVLVFWHLILKEGRYSDYPKLLDAGVIPRIVTIQLRFFPADVLPGRPAAGLMLDKYFFASLAACAFMLNMLYDLEPEYLPTGMLALIRDCIHVNIIAAVSMPSVFLVGRLHGPPDKATKRVHIARILKAFRRILGISLGAISTGSSPVRKALAASIHNFPSREVNLFKHGLSRAEQAQDTIWKSTIHALELTQDLIRLRREYRSRVRVHCHSQTVSPSSSQVGPVVTLNFHIQCSFSIESPPQRVRQCTGCLSAYYCSRSCQKADWRIRHKERCRVMMEDELYGGPIGMTAKR